MVAVGKGKLEKYASYQSSDDDTKEEKGSQDRRSLQC